MAASALEHRALAGATGSRTLLALDQSSSACGVAHFEDGALVAATVLTASSKDFLVRMERITASLLAWADEQRLGRPDLVVLEGLGYGGARKSIRNLVIMSQVRGYLMRALRERWPGVELMDVASIRAKRVVGAPLKRVEALPIQIEYATALARHEGLPLEGELREDAASAVCIGRAALIVRALPAEAPKKKPKRTKADAESAVAPSSAAGAKRATKQKARP